MEDKRIEIRQASEQTIVSGGLSVRTDLRAGLSWEETQQQISDLWGQLSNAVSGAFSNPGGDNAGNTPA